jgi:cytochrome P450
MSREEIMNTSGILIIAGSETTATLLDGAMFYLLTNPSVLEKLATEIVTAFPDIKDMTFAKLANLPYLDACLQEALRMYPPIPGLLARKTLPGGVVINGYFIPGGVSTCSTFCYVLWEK